ncbi:MAG TPA: MBL fold metallo-hydrolase [Candidatus Blautia stercoripullorum]|uniref:MBL fold metallo-hydrolase n=1 Tax=Candidatus Blautia stercoripullorum TaxID=2838502 RepID=A0A9D2RC52_9FIRM|nr:MBL fold metallo-hydrolase [Candidatus Blautia stercoripullorum]
MVHARVLERQDEPEGEQENSAGQLSVTYLDVGQGNGILVQCDDQTMLIDGGPRESSSFVVSYLNQMGIQKLDYILISHFDEDHLAGAVGALYNFSVDTLLTPDYETDTAIYDSYTEAAEENGCEAVHPSLRDTFSLGSGSFQIISPVSYGHEDENQDSIGIIIKNGSDRFFIGGDIGLEGEQEILESGMDIQADVMLMNHHGSHVSREFFQAVDPSWAVISCGENNSYGHPRQDTVELLQEFQVPLFRTDKQGTITAVSKGQGITFDQAPCNDYTPGENTLGEEEENLEETRENLSNSTRESCDYILNIHTKKIHLPDCSSVKSMNEDNMAFYKGDQNTLLAQGYSLCGNCMR